MAELLIRASSQDAALLRRLYGLDGQRVPPARPSRVVVDAHVPASNRGKDIAESARRAGVPLLIDPQTFYLQGTQHANDPWAMLPYGRANKISPTDLDAFSQEELVGNVIQYQIAHGATAIIPPYLHLDRLNSEWIDVQAGLWGRTRRRLDRENIALPVTAVFALGWRALNPLQRHSPLTPALTALSDLAPREVALAVSKADQGVRAQDRVMDFVLMIEMLRSRNHEVIAWQQGHLGELAVVAGARGYESGIGWREGCDLGAAANAHRHPQLAGARSARPVFVAPLGRSVPKRSLELLRTHRDLWTQVICPDSDCCPPGGLGLLSDARGHALVQRARSIEQLDGIDRQVWRWQHLARTADDGLRLAERINRRALNEPKMTQINTRALAAIGAVSHTRRLDIRSRHVA